MKVDFVTVVKIDSQKRIDLFKQTLSSLLDNTSINFINRIVIFDDESSVGLMKIINDIRGSREVEVVIVSAGRKGVGGGKNHAVGVCEDMGRGQYLYMFDGDVYFTQGWLTHLMNTYTTVSDQFKILAGGIHPFLQPRASEALQNVTSHDALSGWSWFMHYSVWDEYGKLADNALGSGQSEDWEYCQRIRNNGYKVGCVQPQVIAHCGITNTEDRPIVGQQESINLAKGVAPSALLL